MRWQGLWKWCSCFAHAQKQKQTSVSTQRLAHTLRCAKLFLFCTSFSISLQFFRVFSPFLSEIAGFREWHNALHAVLLLYLITGCFMIMLLYVLRLTRIFMCHVFAIKKALISSFTRPVAAFAHTHTKCEMCYLFAVCWYVHSHVLWFLCAFVLYA